MHKDRCEQKITISRPKAEGFVVLLARTHVHCDAEIQPVDLNPNHNRPFYFIPWMLKMGYRFVFYTRPVI